MDWVDLSSFTDPASYATSAALKRPLDMPFPDSTRLDDVLNYIRASTRGENLPEGLPIYVDPAGLREAGQTMYSTVFLEAKGMPARKALQLILAQVGLTCTVEDGLLTITSPSRASVVDRVEAFRRVGHALFAIVFGIVGGLSARFIRGTRSPIGDD